LPEIIDYTRGKAIRALLFKDNVFKSDIINYAYGKAARAFLFKNDVFKSDNTAFESAADIKSKKLKFFEKRRGEGESFVRKRSPA
jgi:hypothetical protein